MKLKTLFTSIFMLLAVSASPLMVNAFSNYQNNDYVIARAESATVDQFVATFDEIFITGNKSICDATRDDYNAVILVYSNLSEGDRATVNQLERTNPQGETYKIEDAIKELVRMFYTSPSGAVNNKKKLDQTTTIIIASVVSIVGMSAISVLFIMKNNKYIE